MKRNIFKRALRTFVQSAAPAFVAAVYAGMQSGDFTTGMLTGAAIAGGAAGLSALQNLWDNRAREGQPTED